MAQHCVLAGMVVHSDDWLDSVDGICRKSPSWLCGRYQHRINWYIMMRIRKDLCFYDICVKFPFNSHANGARGVKFGLSGYLFSILCVCKKRRLRQGYSMQSLVLAFAACR